LKPPLIVQFGAGAVGRGLVGQLFSAAGWRVVFVDADNDLVRLINEKGCYRILVKDEPATEMLVENVRAVASGSEEVPQLLAEADLASTAVGPGALEKACKTIAPGLVVRRSRTPRSLDILICENVRRAVPLVRGYLAPHLPKDFPISELVGIVQAAVGKMSAPLSDQARREDPLQIRTEAFNTLIVDRRAFLGPIPSVEGLEAVENFEAQADRKLFIHNMGHSLAAYVGYLCYPHRRYVWQVMEDDNIRHATERAMNEAGSSLLSEYPGVFSDADQHAHISDLLRRFSNRRLPDTLHRVGRDIKRKLGPGERFMGALRLCLEHRVEPRYTTLGIACALLFTAADEEGKLYRADQEWFCRAAALAPRQAASELCGLDHSSAEDSAILDKIEKAAAFLSSSKGAGSHWLRIFDQGGFEAFTPLA
jgi:mannitol-1-phosphate 5-dehydrogenase